MKVLRALGKIEFIFVKRSLSTLLLSIGLPVGIFLLITGMLGNTDNIPKDALNVIIRDILISMTVYSSLSFALFNFPMSIQEDRANNWFTFLNQAPLKISDYYFMRIFRTVMSFAFAVVVVFLVGKILKGVTMPVSDWLIAGLLIILGSSAMLSIGLLLSFINSAEKLSVVANITYLVLSMLGGLWWPLSQFSTAMRKMGELLPTHHIRELAIHYVNNHEIATKSVLFLLGYAIIFVTIAYILRRKIEVK